MPTPSSVVLLAGPGDSTNIVFHALDVSIGIDRVLLENHASRSQLLRRRAKRLGVHKVLGQVMFQASVQRLLRRRSRPRIAQILDEAGLDDSPIPEDRMVRVESVNCEAARELLRLVNPKVVVINGTRIIGKRTLSCVPATFINMHAGITPEYRGAHGGYWALANRTPDQCGVTVHVVDPGIDTGGIIAQARIHPGASDNFATYPYLQLRAGMPLLDKAVRGALGDRLELLERPDAKSQLWYHPTIVEYVANRVLHGVK